MIAAKTSMKTIAGIFLTVMAIMVSTFAETGTKWVEIDCGLHYAEFDSPRKADARDSKIFVVRADPSLYDLKLLCLSELGEKSKGLTVKQWTEKHGLVAAINAGMYQTDEKSNVGYMQNFAHKNNPLVNGKYLSVAAFNAKDASLASFMLFDMEQKKIPEIEKNYNTVVQNLRLIKSPGITCGPRMTRSGARLRSDRTNRGMCCSSSPDCHTSCTISTKYCYSFPLKSRVPNILMAGRQHRSTFQPKASRSKNSAAMSRNSLKTMTTRHPGLCRMFSG